jgi:hypothetical protein
MRISVARDSSSFRSMGNLDRKPRSVNAIRRSCLFRQVVAPRSRSHDPERIIPVAVEAR